jgi:hypothetical protein
VGTLATFRKPAHGFGEANFAHDDKRDDRTRKKETRNTRTDETVHNRASKLVRRRELIRGHAFLSALLDTPHSRAERKHTPPEPTINDPKQQSVREIERGRERGRNDESGFLQTATRTTREGKKN